jgi:hypothetical protein
VPAVVPDVVARVNGESVTKAELEEAVAAVEQQNRGKLPPDQRDRVFRAVLDQLVGVKLLAQEVKARNVSVPEADVEAQIAACASSSRPRTSSIRRSRRSRRRWTV